MVHIAHIWLLIIFVLKKILNGICILTNHSICTIHFPMVFLYLFLIVAFHFCHKIKQNFSVLPSNASWINNGSYYVIRAHQLRHIGHFSECLNHLLLKLRFPSLYPVLTDLYIPEFKQNEYEWSKTYLKLTLALFPKEFKPNIHLYNSIKIDSIMCFKNAVCDFGLDELSGIVR